MKYNVDGEEIPVCPCCGRAQPLDNGVFVWHYDAPTEPKYRCMGSRQTPAIAAEVAKGN